MHVDDMDPESRLKIIIDTDCGIDDALALLLALNEKKRAEVLAVTCVFGNTTVDNVCSNVMRVLTVCEERVPIYRGCAGPIVKQEQPPTVHGSDGLGECAHKFSTGSLPVEQTTGPAALINFVNRYPKEVVLLAIGPLTNVAIAHRMDENFFGNLKSLVIMGGNYKGIGNITEVAEFNFYCDPLAANIVLTEATCPITVVPWETTTEYGIRMDLYNELVEIKTKKGEFFKGITELHSGFDDDGYIDCDFLAAAVATYPECIKSSEKHALMVETSGMYTTGLTILRKESTNDSTSLTKACIITGLHNEILCKLRREMLQNSC